MFNLASDSGYPEVFMRPQESLNIPFKYQSFKTTYEQDSSNPLGTMIKDVTRKVANKGQLPRSIKVSHHYCFFFFYFLLFILYFIVISRSFLKLLSSNVLESFRSTLNFNLSLSTRPSDSTVLSKHTLRNPSDCHLGTH